MANFRIDVPLLPILFAGLLVAVSPAKGQGIERAGQPLIPPAAQADAPFDLTGYWVSVITQNWRYRMVVPPKGDYMGIPLSLEAKKVADAWDPAKDEASGEQCKGYSAAAIMSNPERLHITWPDNQTLRMDIDAGMQTRLLHFGNWKSSGAAPGWQGDSVASWSPRAGLAFVSSPKARSLKVTTTHMRPGYLRKNGVPFSAGATLTEYFDIFKEPEGETWMTVTTVVQDPVYLENPLILSAQFRKERDASRWDPTPCSTKW